EIAADLGDGLCGEHGPLRSGGRDGGEEPVVGEVVIEIDEEGVGAGDGPTGLIDGAGGEDGGHAAALVEECAVGDVVEVGDGPGGLVDNVPAGLGQGVGGDRGEAHSGGHRADGAAGEEITTA